MRKKLSGLMMGAVVGGLLVAPACVRADDNTDAPGPIDSLQDLQDTGQMFFKLADTNNDNRISQKEAVDVGNLMVGGFFFRADTDGDGAVSKEEAQQSRDALLRQKPLLRIVLERAPKGGSGEGSDVKDAMQGLMSVVDSNTDGKLQATELRQMVQTSVQGLYAQADNNRDGQLTPSELNAAATGMVQAAGQASFQAADADNDGSLSQEEYNKMIMEPARVVFRIIDADGDGKISKQESTSAQQTVSRQLKMLNVPEPDNSLSNKVEDATQRGGAPATASPRTPGGNRENAPQKGERRQQRQPQ